MRIALDRIEYFRVSIDKRPEQINRLPPFVEHIVTVSVSNESCEILESQFKVN